MDEELIKLNLQMRQTPARSCHPDDVHLETGRILALYHNQLPELDQQQIEAHIMSCQQCAEIVKGIAHFFDVLPQHSSAAEMIHAWERFRQSLEISDHTGVRATTEPLEENLQPRWRRPPKGFVAKRTVLNMTIGFLLIIVVLAGLSGYEWLKARKAVQAQATTEQMVARLYQRGQTLEQENQSLKEATQRQIKALSEQVKELASLRLNWPVYDVFSQAFLRRAGGQKKANEIELAAGVSGFSLILNAENHGHYPDYRIEITDATGQIVWQGDGLQRNQLDAFNIAVPKDRLTMDHYTIKIYGKSGTRLSLLEEYPIVMKSAARAARPSTPN
jgi:hypothetical protein